MTEPELAAVHVCLGRYGNGDERRRRLTEAGFDPDQIQGIVNRIMYDQIEPTPGDDIRPLSVELDLEKYNALEVIIK